MKATVNPDLCTGCRVCEIVCPEVFRMNGGGRKDFAVVHSETVSEDAAYFCVDARDCCKAKAIQVVAGRHPAPTMAVHTASEF